MQELDKAALDRWITCEPKWMEDEEGGSVMDGCDDGPDPDLLYDQMREAELWGM